MPNSRWTMVFAYTTNQSGAALQQHTAGWTESWYDNNAVNPELLNRFFLPLCQKRAALLSNGARIIGQRFQNIDPTGRSQPFGQIFPGGAGEGDLAQAAVRYTLPCDGVPNVRRVTLRGIPDSLIVQGEFLPSTQWRNDFQAFNELLYTGGWKLRGRNLTATKVPLISVADDGTFVLGAPSSFVANDKVTVSRVKIQGGTLSQELIIQTRTDSQHGKFFGWTSGIGSGGTFQERETIIARVLNNPSTPIATTRKVGRPLDAYRGRASARS